MSCLAQKLRTLDYFTLDFGTMVGVGWLVVMDDWLGRGGPLGAILGFAIGGAALLPIGLGLTAWLTILKFRGIRGSVTLQNYTTFGLLALIAIVAVAALASGSAANFMPLFRERGGLISTLLVLQIVPYFMTGFESRPPRQKRARVAAPQLRDPSRCFESEPK